MNGDKSQSGRSFTFLPMRLAKEEILGYSASIFASLGMLLAVAVSIDLGKNFEEVMARRLHDPAELKYLAGVSHLLWYLGLRLVDMTTRLLPFAVFGGVLGFELWSLYSRRRAIHWASGRHPLQLLAGVVFVAGTFGTLQYFCDAVARPLAVMTQAAERLGAYGRRFEREVTPDRRWLMVGSHIIEARIRFRPTPELLQADIYDFDANGRLRELIRTPRVEPVGEAGDWRLHGATRWFAGSPLGPLSVEQEMMAKLDLRPIDLTYFNIPAKYVPQSSLSLIIGNRLSDSTLGEKAVWFHVRRANATLPGVLALLAVAVSLIAGAYRPTGVAIFAMAAAGYLTHATIKSVVTMGELDLIYASTTAWAPVAMILVLALGLLAVGLRRN